MDLFTPKQYLQIDIAGRYGLDAQSWQTRLNWFAAHEHQLMDMVPTAEEPAMYFAAVTAWEDCLAGRPSGYAISLDATCSALQLLSVLTGDRKGAELCNVVDVGERMDAYAAIYQRMSALIDSSAVVSREMAKNAILTALYGSTAVPKAVFGGGDLLAIFYQVMQDSAPAAWELNETYLNIWDSTVSEYNITLPDNFHMHLKVMTQVKDTVFFLDQPYDVYTAVNAPMESGRMLGANSNHGIDGMIVREMTARCDYDPTNIIACKLALHMAGTVETVDEDHPETILCRTLWAHFEETGFLSARILQCLNAQTATLVNHDVIMELIGSLPAKPFRLMTVHDCFRCLPAYGNDMRKQYNLMLHLIGKSDLLSSVLSQIMGRQVVIGKLDRTLCDDVLHANYSLS
jgi:hypothetical protein